jgi:hypothetical protein
MDTMFSEMLGAQLPSPLTVHKPTQGRQKLALRDIINRSSRYNFPVLMHLI